MDRRAFLQLPAIAPLAAAAAPPAAFKLSIRVEGMFKKLTLPEQMKRVAAAGYKGFEFGNWRAENPVEISKLAQYLGLECACIVVRGPTDAGMSLTDPKDRGNFLAAVKDSTEAAKRFNTTRMVTLAGKEIPGVPREAQHKSVVEGLKAAHDIVAPAGVTMILERFNTLVNHPGAYLAFMKEAFEIVKEVGSPYLKILFDIYHVQIMEGNLINTITKNISMIGHFHVADNPGRHEPGTGEINYLSVFRAIQQTGYRDFVGMEYNPSKDPDVTLAEVKSLWQTATRQ